MRLLQMCIMIVVCKRSDMRCPYKLVLLLKSIALGLTIDTWPFPPGNSLSKAYAVKGWWFGSRAEPNADRGTAAGNGSLSSPWYSWILCAASFIAICETLACHTVCGTWMRNSCFRDRERKRSRSKIQTFSSSF